MRSAPLCLVLLAGCGGGDELPAPMLPTVSDPVVVVPSTGLPAEVQAQAANNNLDVTVHDGRVWLAFRTSQTHFASEDTVLYVVSSADEVTWQYEGEFWFGTDIREPQLVSFNGQLVLYFALLGTDPWDFEPIGTRYSVYGGQPGAWGTVENFAIDAFIPWRVQERDGRLYMTGYTGGADIYDPATKEGGLDVHFLASDDGITWDAAVQGQQIVLTGGGSETDVAWLSNGTLIAVVRNEAGDADGFGSKICTAPQTAQGIWTCNTDTKKYDSPNLFVQDDEVYLIARRNLTETGDYDLGRDELSLEEQFGQYQIDYWLQPKRCTLWRVDAEALTVSPIIDLPSRGDTCFAEILPGATGEYVVYNYSSLLEGPDLVWQDAQLEPTFVYRMVLSIP